MNPVYNGYADFRDLNGTVGAHNKGPGEWNRHQRESKTAYQVRHPDYRDTVDRFISFTHWRHSHLQDSTHLVNYGFFYTGDADLVRCFFCGLGLRDFEKSDDPLLEHVRYSGDCGFLMQLLGPGRLREIKEGLELNQASNIGTELNRTPRLSNSRNEPTGLTNTEVATTTENHRYRHPEYTSVSIRVASFSGWPRNLLQTPQKVAEAGFYYTGVGDIVRCFSCDGGLQKWAPSDDPWIEHCVNFPYCKFLKETKGDDYIALARAPQSTELPPKRETLRENFEKLKIQDGRQEKSAPIGVRKVRFQVIGMGYSESEVDRAVDSVTKEYLEPSVENIIDEIEKLRKEKELTPIDVVEEHKRLRAQLFCMQCKTEDINSLFLPCQHHRFCSVCSNSLTVCPLCGQTIVHKVKTYRP